MMSKGASRAIDPVPVRGSGAAGAPAAHQIDAHEVGMTATHAAPAQGDTGPIILASMVHRTP